MPLRHLEAGAEACESDGSVVLPAGGPGDLEATPPGSRVLVIATEAGDAEVPAATWSGRFAGRVAHEPSEPWPAGLPATWVEEHGAPEHVAPAGTDAEPAEEEEDEEDDDDEDDDRPGPQSFFRVIDLAPMARERWIFANELVPKQERGGRTFVPRTPRLLSLID
jgi:hypothetical protein